MQASGGENPVRCFLMIKGRIAAVEVLEPAPDEKLIEHGHALLARFGAERQFDGFEIWDFARRVYLWPPRGSSDATGRPPAARRIHAGSQPPLGWLHLSLMGTPDSELERLRGIEEKACALRDRLLSQSGLISDPTILQHAEDLCREARAAIEAYLAKQRTSAEGAQTR